MKIQHVRESLYRMKEEDLMLLDEIKSAINELEYSLNDKYNELKNIEDKKDMINNIINIKGSKLSLLRFFSPILELMGIGGGIILAILAIDIFPGLMPLFLILILGLSADICHVIERYYIKVTDDNLHIFKLIATAILNIMTKDEKLLAKLTDYTGNEEIVNREIKKMEDEIGSKKSKKEMLKDEVSFLEGNINGVECLMHKYEFKEINPQSEIVKFIQDKKILEKVPSHQLQQLVEN